MKRIALTALLLSLTLPALAKTHKDNYEVSCHVLWPTAKDTLRNSDKYGIISIVNDEMTAS